MYLTAPTRRGLRGLGVSAPQVLSTAAPAAVKAGSAIAAAAGIGGTVVPIIGAGIGALVGIIAGLWAAHAARAKGAQTENAAVNSAVQAFDASLRAVFAAANAGQITGAQAAQACQQIMQSYWAGMAPYQSGPGRADASRGGSNCGTGLNPGGPCIGMPGGPPCNKSCTAGCCVGCQDLYPTILQALAVFNSPTGGTITACNVSGSSYGANTRGSYNLTYTPPPAASVAGVSNALSSLAAASPAALAADIQTSTVAGVPLWLLLAGGVGAFLYFRR
jgi:hypothetical protein